jgi:P-type conjugative transfer protein TrbG
MLRIPFLLSLLAASALFGQQAGTPQQVPSPNSAVEVKRITPVPNKPPSKADTFLDHFDFGANVQALERSMEDVPGSAPSAPPAPGAQKGKAPATPPVSTGPTGVPPGYHPPTDVTLSATAQQAVQFSASWRGQQNTPAPGPDGRVLFAFGAGLPTVVCAPLRVCLIELQLGEKLVGEPQIGDSVRWNVSPAMYGKGEESTAVLVLKPQMPGLDTNLLITTDRRAYYVRIVSKAEDYVSRVAFVYNDDDGGKKWKEHFAEQKREELAAAREAPPEKSGALIAVEHLHFDYQIKGGDENMRPRRVFDDGSKTYIQMSPNVTNREAPVLVVMGPDGKGEMVNYRMKDQTYIVDRLFEHAQLVLGSGKKAQKVEIIRDNRG